MLLEGDLFSNKWKYNFKTLAVSSDSVDLFFGFSNNGIKPVEFNNLSFGYELYFESELIQSNSYPTAGEIYLSTDQEYLETDRVLGIRTNRDYSVFVWAENNGIRFSDTFIFHNPKPRSPYPSWIWNDEEEIWFAPIPYPNDGGKYIWNEKRQRWQPKV